MGCHWDQQWECDAVLSTEGTQKKKKSREQRVI